MSSRSDDIGEKGRSHIRLYAMLSLKNFKQRNNLTRFCIWKRALVTKVDMSVEENRETS